MSKNPMMTFPIKKIINTIDERVELYRQNGQPKLSGQFEEGKHWHQDHQ